MDVSTFDNRYSVWSTIKSIYGKNTGLGLAQICLQISVSLCYEHLVYSIILAVYQLSTEISRLVRLLNLGHYDIDI
jgi:hypothetical protein